MVNKVTPKQQLAPARSGADGRAPDLVDVETIPLVHEQLSVDKVSIDQGGYRIVKHVQTTTALADELLRDSSVEIERRPMNTPIEGSVVPTQRQEGDTLVIPVVREVLVTEKRLVLVEEVRITRVHTTHRAPQSVELLQEEVSVERLAPEPENKRKPKAKSDRSA
jgi:uncharacterized protein (TIGR02271 family)